jgi:hypothetical protein
LDNLELAARGPQRRFSVLPELDSRALSLASAGGELSPLRPASTSPASRVLLLLAAAFILLSPRRAQAANLFSSTNAARSRVVLVQDPAATDAFEPRPGVIRDMVARAITHLTGKINPAEAWRAVLSTNGLAPTNQVIGIKVLSEPGPNSGTRPAVVAAVVEGLLAAGVPPKHIIVWDRQAYHLRLAGFFDFADRYGIRVASSAEAGYDEQTFYDTALIGNLVWGDLEFGRKGPGVGRKSFVSKLVSQEMTKIINITPMLNHNLAGVSGNLYSLALGSVDNVVRFESDADRLATAVPEIYALPALSDRVVLNITDALVCQYLGSERGLLHYSDTLNQLRFSRDPVALDVLSLKELDRQRQAAKAPDIKPNLDLYNNAALLELGVSDPKNIQIDTVP